MDERFSLSVTDDMVALSFTQQNVFFSTPSAFAIKRLNFLHLLSYHILLPPGITLISKLSPPESVKLYFQNKSA
jgi:hypothetical protein